MTVDISVIIPTINEALYIEETLKHVTSQTLNLNSEIIVCDGGSTDRTVEIASKYARTIICPTQNTGAQLDFAVRFSKGRILVFLDADTIIPDSYLQRVCNSFENDANLFACGATFVYAGRKRHIIKVAGISTTITENILVNFAMYMWYILRDAFHFTEIPGCNFCVRREIFLAVGGFSHSYSAPVDVALSTSIRALIRRRGKGKMRILRSIVVLTSPRNVTLKRSIKIAKDYKKRLARVRYN